MTLTDGKDDATGEGVGGGFVDGKKLYRDVAKYSLSAVGLEGVGGDDDDVFSVAVFVNVVFFCECWETDSRVVAVAVGFPVRTLAVADTDELEGAP